METEMCFLEKWYQHPLIKVNCFVTVSSISSLQELISPYSLSSGLCLTNKPHQGLYTPSEKRACNSTYACTVEMAKCWWLLKIEPNAWAGGKGSCSACVDLQAVGALEFFGELYSLAKGFGPFLRGVWAGFREREGSIFSNHQHFAVSTGICGVACPLLRRSI